MVDYLIADKNLLIKTKGSGDHAYSKHPVLLLPSGPDKVRAL